MNLRYICLLSVLVIASGLFAQKKLVILHTNDTHSRIEALPSSDKSYPNTAGVVNRESVIEDLRKNNKNVLLFDVGDFVQGTPYFNLFKGRVEGQAMNLMKYDAGTLGNHEFDYGLDALKRIIKELDYPILNCNYDFSNTVLKDVVKPYAIFKKDGLKIGVIGVGVDPEGLIQKDKYEGMIFNPINESVNKYAEFLKKKEKCDVIICLSHIGYNDDVKLAQSTKYVDVILGGHSHTYMEEPEHIRNTQGNDVLMFQLGKNGSFVGKVELDLEKTRK